VVFAYIVPGSCSYGTLWNRIEILLKISVGRMLAKGELAVSESDLVQTKREADTIRADLIGQNQASACGVVVSGRNAPVLALCRALLDAGHDPATPLDAYRGATLCLRVRSEGAKLTVAESGGKPRFVSFHPFQDRDGPVGGRPPMRQTAEEAA
jgi:hypothetical protein